MALLIFYILLALLVSFLCSILEAALLTLTPASIAGAKDKGLKWGPRMEALKVDIDRPLSAILTLNTIAHTMGAAGAGAQYARLFGNVGEAIFAGALTLAILVVTEIIPKTLGARFAVPLAGPVSIILEFLILVLKPLVWCSKKLTGLITPGGHRKNTQVQREEILAITRMAGKSGSLGPRESQFMQNLIQLHGMKARDIMTPRTVIYSLPQSTTLREFTEQIEDKPFTRIPVFKSTRDEMTGFVIREEALIAHLKSGEKTGTLEQLVRPIAMTPQDTPADVLFQRFISERHQLMLVADEFGTIVGLVSFEDVIETIFGFEILDEKDEVADMQKHARNLWHQRAKKMGVSVDNHERDPESNEPR